MKIFLGVIKFLAAFVILLSCFTIVQENLKDWHVLLVVLFIFLIFGLYIYYLVRTSIWNFNGSFYKRNIFVFIGLVIHFIFIGLCLWYETRHYKEQFFFTILLIIPFMLLCGLYDARNFYRLWKNKRSSFINVEN
jgi:uncharacterized membrane protein